MRRKLVHAFVTLATFMVVWLVTSPARAFSDRAPVCDPRGAIGFAPPPQIQDAELSLDIPADCADISPLESKNFMPGRGAPIDFSSSQEPASVTTPALPVLVLAERLPVRITTCARPPPGVRSPLERPPRA
jgi:hypothetical protein